MTNSHDRILGIFPRQPLSFGKEVGVGGEAFVGGVPSPGCNLDYIVPGGDEQADVGVSAGVGRVPVSEAEGLDGGTPDPGSPVPPGDLGSTGVCNHVRVHRWSSTTCYKCGEIIGHGLHDRNAPGGPSLGGLDGPTPDADAPVHEDRVLPDLPPGQTNHLAGPESRVCEQAYDEAVARLDELMADRFDLSDWDRETLGRTLREWLESDAGVRLAQAILYGGTEGGTQHSIGAVDGVAGGATTVKQRTPFTNFGAGQVSKPYTPKVGEHVQFDQTRPLHAGGPGPSNPVIGEPVLQPLFDGELTIGNRLSVTLELSHEGDGLWLAGESLRVHAPTGTPPYAPGFAGSFLMVEPHGPGSYSATVRGVVKSVVRLADD